MLIRKELKVFMTTKSRAGRIAWPLAVALLAFVFAVTISAEIIEQVLVKVNGEILTKTDLEQRQVQALRARGIQPPDDEALKKAIAEITPPLLVETIDEMLLVQRGKELGFKMNDEEFNRVVTRIRTDNKLETEEAFLAALKQEGLSVSDLRNTLERQMLISRVQQQEVMQKISITEEEARKYHSEHVNEFTKPGQVTVREILVSAPKSDQGINVGLEEEAKARAEAARKRIVDGESFEIVAGEVSNSPSRANGGLVGPLNPAELTPAFQEILKGMKPGDITEVLRTAGGYQIVKLESQTPDEVLTAEQARDRIADVIFDQKRQVELKKYLDRLRAQAIIEWKNEEIKKAWLSRVEPPAAEPAAEPAAKPAAKPATE
jgi:peptidyl-prolyl cis-trans isomerase SurA